jgi:uncharacterized protein (DUF488 family)
MLLGSNAQAIACERVPLADENASGPNQCAARYRCVIQPGLFPEPDLPVALWTIGHSTHGIEKLAGLLQAHAIELVADVRQFPVSRRYPHFNAEPLRIALRGHGIGYEHFVDLGGRRRPLPDSPNTAWRNASFRGYADYMETTVFAAAMARLLERSREGRVALMCAEAVWWRCHRSLISDYLKARGLGVAHISSETKAELHPWTSAARIVNGRDAPPRMPPISAAYGMA